MPLAFDHLLLAVPDLEAAGERLLAEHGLASLPGGRHAGHGTANRIVPLGSDYLELITVVDPEEAASSPVGRWIARGLERHGGRSDGRGDGLWGLNLRTPDAEAVAARLGLEVLEFVRKKPDGSTIRFRLVGLEGATGDEQLPFYSEHPFVERESNEHGSSEHGGVGPEHPGRQPAPHRIRPQGIAWVELGGDERRLRDWIGPETAELDLRFADGPPGIRRAGVATDAGEIVLAR